jgi:hypothetical protein
MLINANATPASNIYVWSTFVSPIWQILKTSYQDMFVYYSLLIPQHNLDYVMFKIQLLIVQKFNQNVVARCLPLNLKHAYYSSFVCPSSFFLCRICPKQNAFQIAIITLLYWNKNIVNFIILMSMHFLPMQICSHCLLTCFLYALLIRNMNFV